MTNVELRLAVHRTVRASNAELWKVLGDFGTEHRWTRSLIHCERDTPLVRVGTVRTCTLPKPLMGRTEVREEVTAYEPGEALAYKLEGPAGPFATAASRWATRAISDDATQLTVEGCFTPRNWFARYVLWPLARPMIRRLTSRVIGELTAHVALRRNA